MEEKKSRLKILTNGIINENPVLVLLLGCCSALATSSSAINGLGMGVSFTVVMVLSNIVISALRKLIPNNVRIPCYIVVIAGFVTVVQMLLEAFAPSISKSLGVFIPLIVVNCIVLGRAEMFANKNTVIDSALDGIGMGIGYTLVVCLMGLFREFLAHGTLFDVQILPKALPGVGVMGLAPGGFFAFALAVALVTWIKRDKTQVQHEFYEEELAVLEQRKAEAAAKKAAAAVPAPDKPAVSASAVKPAGTAKAAPAEAAEKKEA